MKSLSEIYSRHRNITMDGLGWGDKGTIHSYISVYQELFAPYKDIQGTVLEIGILTGQSLLMWEEYFDKATVYGMDASDQPLDGKVDLRPLIATGQHHILIGNAEDRSEVDRLFGDLRFNIIIEDANHTLQQQLAIYANFKDRMLPGGLYVIEDVADLDRDRAIFENLDPKRQIEVFDLRSVKRRYDDVCVVIHT